MLKSLKVPIGWGAILKRTVSEMAADNCLDLAAELAYYFFLALFPALLFLVALAGFLPLGNAVETVTTTLARVAPAEVIEIIRNQLLTIAHGKSGGLLTLGVVGAIDTLNQAYDIQDGRPWWRVKLLSIALTVGLALFIMLSTVLVIAGPELAGHVAGWLHLGAAFAWTWKILQWPFVFALVSLAIAVVYYFAPDAKQEWIWITPGSLVATLLWLVISLGFRFYVQRFGGYNATYGAIGGVIVVLLWFYLSGLAVLAGAELNAEIEHASPYGKDPGEKVAGEKQSLEALAKHDREEQMRPGTFKPALTTSNCDLS
jgi:membrane protein